MKDFTFKNVILAVVALQILSIVSTGLLGGTFHSIKSIESQPVPHSALPEAAGDAAIERAKPAPDRLRAPHETGRAADAVSNADRFPGVALLPGVVLPSGETADTGDPAPPVAQLQSQPQSVLTIPAPAGRRDMPHAAPGSKSNKTQSSPPLVGWTMLLTVVAMALYVRYLMARAAAYAGGQVLDAAKDAARAAGGLFAQVRSGVRQGVARPVPASQPQLHPKTPPVPTYKAPPRKSTVVRASRWPLFS